jgi:hypothetical protein
VPSTWSSIPPRTAVPLPIRSHPLYYADANEAEIAINAKLLRRIGILFSPPMPHIIEITKNAFVDFLVLARQTDQMPERAEIHQMTNMDFSFHPLLFHMSIQDWSLPRRGCCPCSFCGETGDPNGMEEHLRADHPTVYGQNAFYTEIQFQLAGLLGVGLEVEKRHNWGCPFGNCNEGINRYAEIADHVLKCGLAVDIRHKGQVRAAPPFILQISHILVFSCLRTESASLAAAYAVHRKNFFATYAGCWLRDQLKCC